jgi:phage/plasmid-associated DNA primase
MPDVCTVNFVDLPFDQEWTRLPLDHEDFEVDGYSDIVTSQNYDADMKMWLDVFFGRLFFPIGEFDGWEKLMVIKGWAATGKSTVAKGIAKLIGEVNVGYVASNCEEQWALASIHDKLMWMCLELKSNFRLPTGTMQSMASGEVVVVNEKHKTAFDKVWTIQGLLVGNELPLAWTTDAMNALVRRVVPFPFDLPPITQDSTVSSRFMRSIPKFLARVTRMYIAKCAELGSTPIDGVLPTRLREASDDFKKRAAPLFRFLEEAKDSVGEYEMASPDERIRIMHRLIEKGVNPVALSVDVAAIKREYDTLMATTPSSFGNDDALLEMYHVTMDDVKASFRQWMQISGELAKNIPNIQLQENYKPSARDFKLGVASGVLVGQKEIKTLCWFGIKKSSAAAAGQHYDMAYGAE